LSKSKLIIVNGQPGTGKTTLSHKIATQFDVPLISKDTIKEIIFDNVGYSDREWSVKVGGATYRIMDYFVKEQLRAGHNLIIESNFNPKFDDFKFQKWQKEYNFKVLQIILHAETQVLIDRFEKRNKSGERHPGHDDDNFETAERISQPLEPLNIDGQTIQVDTTDFTKIDYKAIYESVKALN